MGGGLLAGWKTVGFSEEINFCREATEWHFFTTSIKTKIQAQLFNYYDKALLLCLLLALSSLKASAQFFQWAKKQENSMGENAFASDNSLIASTGSFSRTITLGNQTFTAVDSMDNYLAVRDHSGNNLWAKHIINGKNSNPEQAVTLDANQNIIITGSFIDSLYIDGLIFKGTTANESGVYVAKFSPTGTLLWAKSSDLSISHLNKNPYAISVTTDANSNVFVTGGFVNTISFNSTNLITTINGRSDAFIVKYNAAGTFQWAINTPNTFNENAFKAKATSSGEIYLINKAFLAGPSGGNTFELYKYSSLGTLLWSKTIGNYSSPFPNLTVDNMNNAYITGYHITNITIGNTTLIPTQTNVFLAKIDAAGNWKWARTIASNIVGSNLATLGIFYSIKNELGLSGTFGGSPQFNNFSITSASGAGINTFVAKLDTAGTPLWVNNTSSSGNIYNTDLSGDNNGNLFIGGFFYNGSYQFSTTTLTTTSGTASYLAKVTNEANSVSGTIFFDSNSNGVRDASESGNGHVLLQTTPGAIFGISAQNGTYNFYLPTGTNTVSIPNPPSYYTLTPSSRSVTFSGMNQAQNNQDFALQPIPNSNDVKVTVTNITPARPGFQTKYRLTFHNSGTTVLSDTVKFSHSASILSFVSASVAPATNSNGKIAWYYQNLQPNETRNIDVTFSVPTTTVLGAPLQAIASIKPLVIDLLQEDNIDTLNHQVVGSYDPNDKQVDKITLSPSVAANGEFLDYTIRFQNTGTDTAFTVVITDRISTKLNLSEFEMLSASHNYKLNVVDGNMLEWRFDNILLPDSNRNEAASHGFIRFRVKSNAGLVLGDSITNNAAIYFDYNAPVITNYAVTKVANPTGIKENKEANILAFRLYPNPAKNYVIVDASFKKNTMATVSLVNLLGQTISNVNLPANNHIHYQMPLNDLPTGVYLIKLQTESGMQTQRLVIQ